jgi:uncharacterized protein YdhG (YjbR/CyaY superfamily)
MEIRKVALKSIDQHIASFPGETQIILKGLRATIRAAAPGAEEKISYGIPAFVLKGNLVYFAAFKKHIGFYPTSSAIKAFKRELSAYEVGKGTVRFPIDEPLPLKLISRIVKFRVAENIKNTEIRSIKRKQHAF